MDQIILFGDSITQESSSQSRGFGFHPALQDAYQRRIDVVNRGLSGYNTIQALKVLPHIIPSPSQARVRLLTVFFGANDACVPESEAKQGVPLPEYRENLKKILTHPAVEAHKPALVMITPPPLDEYVRDEFDLASGNQQGNRTAHGTKAYAEAAVAVGKELNVPVFDLWSIFMKKAGWSPESETLPGSKKHDASPFLAELMHDGLHLYPAAYKIMFDEFITFLTQAYPELEPERLATVLPGWNEPAAWEKFEKAT